MAPLMVARTVAEMYARRAVDRAVTRRLLDTSLHPRGPDLLFERAQELGLGPGSTVLDVGCRDGAHLIELHRRTGCRGVGLEPVADNLARASTDISAAPIGLIRGRAESMPFGDAVFDLVWVRDVLVHVEPLTRALRECRRVLRAGSPVLVFHTLATPWLEPDEAARLLPTLAVAAGNIDRVRFERSIASAGLRIEHRDEIGSEWREHAMERNDDAGRPLLWAARLLREPDRFKPTLGEVAYAGELANCLWTIYQMIGKLSPVVYVLR